MSAKRNSLPLPPSLPAAARKLFARFPVDTGNGSRAYTERLAAILATIRPDDSIEAFWAKDFVDLTLEIERSRQVEAGLLETQTHEDDRIHDAIQLQIAEAAAGLAIYGWARDRGMDHRSDTPEIKAQFAKFVEERLAANSQNKVPQKEPASLSDLAQSFARHSATLDQIGRRIASAEMRRRRILQELERYRSAKRARFRTSDIIDAKFKEPPR